MPYDFLDPDTPFRVSRSEWGSCVIFTSSIELGLLDKFPVPRSMYTAPDSFQGSRSICSSIVTYEFFDQKSQKSPLKPQLD